MEKIFQKPTSVTNSNTAPLKVKSPAKPAIRLKHLFEALRDDLVAQRTSQDERRKQQELVRNGREPDSDELTRTAHMGPMSFPPAGRRAASDRVGAGLAVCVAPRYLGVGLAACAHQDYDKGRCWRRATA